MLCRGTKGCVQRWQPLFGKPSESSYRTISITYHAMYNHFLPSFTKAKPHPKDHQVTFWQIYFFSWIHPTSWRHYQTSPNIKVWWLGCPNVGKVKTISNIVFPFNVHTSWSWSSRLKPLNFQKKNCNCWVQRTGKPCCWWYFSTFPTLYSKFGTA